MRSDGKLVDILLFLTNLIASMADPTSSPRDSSVDAAPMARRSKMLVLSLALAYAAFFALNSRAHRQLTPWGYSWATRFAAAVCHAIGRLFGLRFYMKLDKVPTNGPYLACVSPHGVLPLSLIGFGMWKFCVRAGPYTEQSLVGLDARAAGASILFRIPLLRELLLLANVRDASYDNIIGLLTSGRTVAVNPGGNWEMTNASHEQERIYVQQRLGFIRLAMRTGRPLLPAYAFGESQLFHASTRWLDQRLWMVRRLRIGVPLFTGRWGLPLPIPIPTDVTFVVGREVPVGPPTTTPTDAQVEEVFERYVDEMCRLFREHAAACLPASVAARGLEVHRIGHGLVRHAKL